jgi:hypothetical protein
MVKKRSHAISKMTELAPRSYYAHTPTKQIDINTCNIVDCPKQSIKKVMVLEAKQMAKKNKVTLNIALRWSRIADPR